MATTALIDFEPPWRSYGRLHLAYSLVVLVLIATGLPIQFPDLRASLVGGYGRTLATVHEWAGVALLAVPVLAVVAAPGDALETIQIRSWRRDNLRLHAVNLWFTLVSGAVFVATGFIMWLQAGLPDGVVDAATEIHAALSYALYVMVPLHVITARERIAAAVISRKQAAIEWSNRSRGEP